MIQNTWRLLIDGFADGATNMARDEALAAVHADGTTPPTLRLYRWRPACLSLGRFQRSDAIDREACARAGVEVARRPSGGRALLHDDELTYAVVARADHPLVAGDSIVVSYRRISEALLIGLRGLGVAAELTPVTKDERRKTKDESSLVEPEASTLALPSRSSVVLRPSSAACFDMPASYELTVGGRKLVGSSQTRRAGVLLQHGAIPLSPHADRLAALLADPPDDLGYKMIALDQAIGRTISFDELAAALLAGFADAWGVTFERGALTGEEQAAEQRLRDEKYATERWTYIR
jgi:lipoate-protein ligase A